MSDHLGKAEEMVRGLLVHASVSNELMQEGFVALDDIMHEARKAEIQQDISDEWENLQELAAGLGTAFAMFKNGLDRYRAAKSRLP